MAGAGGGKENEEMGCIGKTLLAAVGLLVFLFVLGLFLDPQRGGGGGGYNAPIETRDLRSSERSRIADAVRGALKDPASAHFKWGRFARQAGGESSGGVYCGLVNAKNSFGAYGGDQPFAVYASLRDGAVYFAKFLNLGESEAGPVCRMMGYEDYYFSTTVQKSAR
jgi:hypothetical protein